ncbi:alpha/beta hydrolase [Phyllobacterium phragmitis]|uniref:alpha/beta hydrolase n=1 Tax=Phyllobacterium phragmitis TaxID=2670329 RepID=UPI0038B4062D
MYSRSLTARIAQLALIILASSAASADTSTTPLKWNSQADKSACPISQGTAVWSEYAGGADCIRYFTSGDVEGAPVAIVMFYGDRGGWIRKRPADIPANTVRDQKAYVEKWVAKVGLPVILVARPGTFGSSGNHFQRRQAREFLALNSALDKIRERHHIGRLVLVGQSGGATAAAALLTLGRNDIACAVLTSGAYGLLERADMLRRRNGKKLQPGYDTTGMRDPYDPLMHVDGIVNDPGRMIAVVGNPNDQATPFVLQRKFADAIRQRGHKVLLIEHAAAPPNYHHLRGPFALELAARCATNSNLDSETLGPSESRWAKPQYIMSIK